MRVLELVRDTIRRHAMLVVGERVLVAVSGGADSAGLLHVLHDLAPSFGLTLHVAHVDHALRQDSSKDAEFVRALAATLGVPVDVERVHVPETGSLEDAARRVRYAALEALAARVGAQRIAMGHTADDQAETVVMRFLEGSGPRGLAGIPATRGAIIRPLIDVRRADIVDWLRARGQAWREDPMNADPTFVRNRVRHVILPLLARDNPAIVDALVRTARLARATVDAIDGVAAAELAAGALVNDGGETVLPLPRLRALPPPVAAEVLRQAAARLGSRAPLRAWAHRGLARVVADPPPRRPFTIGGVRVEVSTGLVRLAHGVRPRLERRELGVPGETLLSEVGRRIESRIVPAAGYLVPRERTVAAFDADALGAPLVVRGRHRGDRFVPWRGPERRVKEFFIHEKLPRWERDAVPIVEVHGTIVWIAGVRRASAAPVTPETRRVLELVLTRLADPPARR